MLIFGCHTTFSFSPHPVMFCRALRWYQSLSECYLRDDLHVTGGSQGEGELGPDLRSPCSPLVRLAGGVVAVMVGRGGAAFIRQRKSPPFGGKYTGVGVPTLRTIHNRALACTPNTHTLLQYYRGRYSVLQESLSQNLSGTLSEPAPRTLRDTTPRPAPLWAAHTPATRELYVALSMASYGICEAQDTHKRQLADVNAWHEHAWNRC